MLRRRAAAICRRLSCRVRALPLVREPAPSAPGSGAGGGDVSGAQSPPPALLRVARLPGYRRRVGPGAPGGRDLRRPSTTRSSATGSCLTRPATRDSRWPCVPPQMHRHRGRAVPRLFDPICGIKSVPFGARQECRLPADDVWFGGQMRVKPGTAITRQTNGPHNLGHALWS
jgi:hypothetical protein